MAEDPKPEPGKDDGPSKEDIEKMQAALHKANEEAKKFRLDAKAKEDELAELRKAQDSSKSEMDKVSEKLAALEERAEKAEREALVAKVAQAKKLPATFANRLSGSTEEELEADADAILEALEEASGGEEEEPGKKPAPSKPKPKLKSGTDPEEEGEPDPLKIAEKISLHEG